MKHVPQRTCIICRQSQAKRDLIRIVRQANGSVQVDESGKASGRGAYLCERPDCWQKALASKGSQRAARLSEALKVKISDGDVALLTRFADALSMSPDEVPKGQSHQND